MKKNRLALISELAQVISAIAVVISLFYVGVQVRQNTKATQALMRQSIADNDINYLMTYLNPDIIAEAEFKLKNNIELTPIEFDQLVRQQQVNFRVFENAYYQYQRGLLEKEVWDRYQIIIARLFTLPHVIEQWKTNRRTYTVSFQREVDNIQMDRTIKKVLEQMAPYQTTQKDQK